MVKTDKPHLLVDAMGPYIHAGVLLEGRWLSFRQGECEALECLFDITSNVLEQASLKFDDLAGFIYCRGPGSLLGLRIAAMAINGWRTFWPKPLYIYTSITLLGDMLGYSGNQPPYHIISPFRQGKFHHYKIVENGEKELGLLPENEADVLSGTVYFMPRTLAKNTPSYATEMILDLAWFPLALTINPECLQSAEIAEPYVPEEAEFALWNAQRHR